MYARDRDALERFCRDLEGQVSGAVVAARSAEEAVQGADIVVTVTTSQTPVVMADWIAPGAHVNAVGANAASRQELDPEILRRASMVVVDDLDQARIEAGELIELAGRGLLDWSNVKVLHEVLASDASSPDRQSVTVFKSLGAGLEDLALGSLIYDRATAGSAKLP